MTSPEAADPILLLERLSANVDGRPVLKDVTLRVAPGEIHAVVGSQGSGKSTLVKVIAGLVPRTAGRFLFDGRPVDRHSPGNAMRLGILTLHHEPGLLPGLSAVENVFMNREVRKFLFFNDWRRMRAQLASALRSIQLDLDMERPIRFLDAPVQQLLEYAKLACFPSRLVVVDPPAARVRPEDVEKLQYLLSVLRQNGTTVLYVTTSTEEVFHFASRVTVIDHGEVVESSEISNIDKRQLVQLTYASLFSRKKLEKNNLELFYLNNLNRNIINNIPIPVIVADSQGSIILANRYFEGIARVSQADILESDIVGFLKLTPAQAELLKKDIDSRRRHELKGWHLVSSAGAAPVDLHVFPILDEEQSFIGTIYLLDVQESRGVFTSQMELFDTYQQNRRTIGEVVHEVNNPLGIMLNYLTLISSSSSLEEIHSNAEVMGRELKRVRRIFSRLAGSGAAAARQERKAKLKDAMGEVLSLLKLNLNERISLSISAGDDFLVPMDPDVLKQVILNIVLNGVEAMPAGGSLSLRQGCVVRDGTGYATLSVSDTGVGIPAENLDRIFEPFFTTKSDRESRGLGLALSKDLLSQAGGFIEVASAAGGTTFTVYIPCKEVTCTSG
jgi:nitrogen-specific signal transduction histidine kinase/ABC-type branched-subunit amino acid transport system ATPase component